MDLCSVFTQSTRYFNSSNLLDTHILLLYVESDQTTFENGYMKGYLYYPTKQFKS